MEKKIPRDRNGTPLTYGDFVRVFLNHGNTNFVAKVIQVGVEKSILEKERRTLDEPVDNQNLEILSSLLTELVEVKTKTSSFYLTKVL
ncbi:MAG: hypothetical protein Q8N59_03655 [bacterium]|nr:hypothetical protein [bacterium]